MNMTGVFGFRVLPTVEVSSPLGNGFDDFDREYKGRNSLTPTQGGRAGGVGGAFFIQVMTNTTRAIVEQGVELYSGTESGLNVKAEEAIMGFAFSQAGASSGKIAVGGTFAYFQQVSDTLAEVQKGSEITGGRVDVYAGSLETQINWAGGVAQSKAVGAGISIAINNTKRTTRAVIGVQDEDDATAPTATPGCVPADLADDVLTPRICVAGAVTSRAIVKGGVYAFTVAGAIANAAGQKDKPSSNAGGNAPSNPNPLPAVSPPTGKNQTAQNQNQSQKAGTAVSLAAAVAVNNIVDTTQASLSDYAVTADAVDVKAWNQVNIVAATGGLAFSKTDAGGNAVALAGAFSYNGVNATTDAWIRRASLTLRDFDLEQVVVETPQKRLSVTADTFGDVWTLAAGGAGAVAAGGTGPSDEGSLAVSLAGSVSVNSVTGHTRARLLETTTTFEVTDEDQDPFILDDPFEQTDTDHPWPSDTSS
jgi:hypothetical protein